ncbi:MAG: GNAT family N-acetyltransferase [Tannerella sp.]|jgi:ribosomal protein S18 acetylase RimI-like enzyme|nr:GNAT family N-acetyltransferase [Tannerella sp.]
MQQYLLSYEAQNEALLRSLRGIYETSFPPDERRRFEDVVRIASSEQAFHVDIYTESGETVGFIMYWNFEKFVYAEHFAVLEKYRGNGYGSTIIRSLLNRLALPLLLEVEKPEDETSARRIRFYEKLGLKLSAVPYRQPPYSADKNSVPMCLMSYGDIDLSKRFDEVRNVLYAKVYGISQNASASNFLGNFQNRNNVPDNLL